MSLRGILATGAALYSPVWKRGWADNLGILVTDRSVVETALEKCRTLEYFMDGKTLAQQEFFFNRLQKNYRRLKKRARKRNFDSFRVYDRDIPEIPLALDVYHIQSVSPEYAGTDAGADAVLYVMMYLYERPYYKDPGEEEMWLTHMKDAAARALDIPRGRVIVSVRKRQRGANQYVKSDGIAVAGVIQENDMKFHIMLGSYIDTGIFLDHRILRGMAREAASGKRVLNLFCYTGAFSVAAALGGAALVDSVDISNTYLETARRNFSLNGLLSSPEYSFIRSDVREFLERSVSQNRVWDIIILDPPAFSNSKKTRGTFDINRDWAVLVNLCLNALDAGGALFFSVHSGRFRFDRNAIAEKTKRGYTAGFADITALTTSEDFSRRTGRGVWKFSVT
ncbi:MAG: class I SAM-dependent methyltransferase [Treponemataceae bacterium]|nr:MAG: class I SAM-dependent methyltransferase [Treponemataceae bacterium]